MDFEDVSKERRFDKAKNQSRCQLCFDKNVVTILKKYNREQEVIMEESKRRSGPSQLPKVSKIEKKRLNTNHPLNFDLTRILD